MREIEDYRTCNQKGVRILQPVDEKAQASENDSHERRMAPPTAKQMGANFPQTNANQMKLQEGMRQQTIATVIK